MKIDLQFIGSQFNKKAKQTFKAVWRWCTRQESNLQPMASECDYSIRLSYGYVFSVGCFLVLTRIADTLHYSKARSNCKTIETVAAGKIIIKSRDGDAALSLSSNFLQFYPGMLVRRFDKKELLH